MSISDPVIRRQVLLVEDDEEDYEFTRDLFAAIPPPPYAISWARDFDAAVQAARSDTFDVCLVDYRLAGVASGVDLAQELITDGHRMPVILLTGSNDRELDEKAASIGAADFLVKGETNAALLDRAIRYAIQSHNALRALQDSYRTTVRALASVLELRDDQTGAHAVRVTELALRLASEVAPEISSEPELEYGFLLHDIGKIGVSDSILRKPGPLDTEEVSHMKRHVELARQVLSQVPYLSGLATEVATAHHERWDGTGYPNGLRGDSIPIAARIFSIIDAYDAMTTDRPYRRAQSQEHALTEIQREAGSQFDPNIVEVFVAMMCRGGRDAQQEPAPDLAWPQSTAV